jgi:hypothetical protein
LPIKVGRIFNLNTGWFLYFLILLSHNKGYIHM